MCVWVAVGVAVAVSAIVVACVLTTHRNVVEDSSGQDDSPMREIANLDSLQNSNIRVVTARIGSARHKKTLNVLSSPNRYLVAPLGHSQDFVFVTDSVPTSKCVGWNIVREPEGRMDPPSWIDVTSVQWSRMRARACKWKYDWTTKDGDVTVWMDFKHT
jgi:hypothetical protein